MSEESKLFIYGLSPSFSNADLELEFGKYGEVRSAYNTGKGYAFLTFAQKEEAEDAIYELDGAMVNGVQIKVLKWEDWDVLQGHENQNNAFLTFWNCP